MDYKNTITQPEKIIPEHLQHNARRWNKHHMAGKQKAHLKELGVGYGIKEPKLDIPNIICEFCGKKFKKSKSMTNHRRWHNLPQYEEFQKTRKKKASIFFKDFIKSQEFKEKQKEGYKNKDWRSFKEKQKEGYEKYVNSGKNCGWKLNKEQREKISKANKGRIKSKKWLKNIGKSLKKTWAEQGHPNVGRKASEETRIRMSKSRKLAIKEGRVFTKESRKNMSKAQKGRKHSEETKKKMRENHRSKRGFPPPTLGKKLKKGEST